MGCTSDNHHLIIEYKMGLLKARVNNKVQWNYRTYQIGKSNIITRNIPWNHSSPILCFFFSWTSSSSLLARSAFAAAASCLAGIWYNTTMYRSCKWKPFKWSRAFLAWEMRIGIMKPNVLNPLDSLPWHLHKQQTPFPSSFVHFRYEFVEYSRNGRINHTSPPQWYCSLSSWQTIYDLPQEVISTIPHEVSKPFIRIIKLETHSWSDYRHYVEFGNPNCLFM